MIDPLLRQPVGSTGIRLSRLGVGGGSSFARAGAQGQSVLDRAWQEGLRYFDTAPLYGLGESEGAFGAALRARPRDQYALSTKAGRLGRETFDYTEPGIRNSVTTSLERLGLEHIDIVYLHDVDPDMHGASFEQRFAEATGGAYAALVQLRREGRIGAIGTGLKDWDVALRMAQAVPLDCVMLAGGYTLLQHGGLERLLPWCERNGVTVVVAAPFNSGILATGAVPGARWYYGEPPPDVLARTRAIEALCREHAVPLPAAALQFPLHHPAVASVVAGHEHPDEVARNLALMRTPIPAAFWHALKRAALIPEAAPTP